MRIWTGPFLLLFLGAAAALSFLVVVFPLPTWLSWLFPGLEVAICLVGGWLMRSRLLRAGFFLQALLAASSLLFLIPVLRPNPSLADSPGYLILSSASALLGVAVFLCLSYGSVAWRTPLDAWLTILQVVLAVGITIYLVSNFPPATVFPNHLGLLIELGISLACQFFVVVLLLRGVCWKHAPVAIALLLAGRLLGLAYAVLPFVIYRLTFLLNFSVINATFSIERVAFPLFLLGLLVLIQTERAARNPLPNPMPALPVPGSS